ncbi:MAG: hypothetical protein B0D91_10375 [Oceanospirillales bacterium LUC14_002_19_P2]|nr:MAG: hypothetical protein B0D91_10375 [Oceanospirillales bacterium LUC14_002_19_P2]
MTLLNGHIKQLGYLSVIGLPLFIAFAAFSDTPVINQTFESNYQGIAHIHTYGERSQYTTELQKQFDKKHDRHSTHRHPLNLHTVNARSPLTESQLNTLKRALSNGDTVIIDNSELINQSHSPSLSANLGGVGFDSTVVMLRKDVNGIPEYKELITYSESPDRLTHHEIEQLATETHTMVTAWKQTRTSRDKGRDQHYRPEVSIPVELRYTGFPCMVGADFHGNGTTGSWYWEDEMIDPCNRGASVSIFYTVDLIRSVATVSGGADDAKYIRITVDPSSNGGAGWHLIDQPSHKHGWFQSWANRETWFGPVADSYYVTIQSRDPDVHLFNTIPSNHPKESQIMHTVGLQVGVSGGPTLFQAKLTGTNPLGFSGITPGLSFTYTSERAISYNNHEYELINLSRAGTTDKAAWIWSREFDKYAKLWRTQRTCELWCQDWFYDDVAFSAAAYSSFTPGFSATFQAPADKTDISVIEFESAIKPVALGGRVQYAFLFQHYTPWGMKGTKYSFRQNLTVNWGATFFNAEIPTSLEAYKESSTNGLCLEVIDSKTAAGSKVGIAECTFEQNQIWGMDSELRYKSFLAPNRCLTREGHETLTIRPCSHAANQKWDWNDDRLYNNLGGAMTITDDGRVIACPHTQTPTAWRNFIRKPQVAGTLTVSALSMQSTVEVHEQDTNKGEDSSDKDSTAGDAKEAGETQHHGQAPSERNDVQGTDGPSEAYAHSFVYEATDDSHTVQPQAPATTIQLSREDD